MRHSDFFTSYMHPDEKTIPRLKGFVKIKLSIINLNISKLKGLKGNLPMIENVGAKPKKYGTNWKMV